MFAMQNFQDFSVHYGREESSAETHYSPALILLSLAGLWLIFVSPLSYVVWSIRYDNFQRMSFLSLLPLSLSLSARGRNNPNLTDAWPSPQFTRPSSDSSSSSSAASPPTLSSKGSPRSSSSSAPSAPSNSGSRIPPLPWTAAVDPHPPSPPTPGCRTSPYMPLRRSSSGCRPSGNRPRTPLPR